MNKILILVLTKYRYLNASVELFRWWAFFIEVSCFKIFQCPCLIKTIIRSMIEYVNCILNHLYKRQSILSDNVQRWTTRMILHLQICLSRKCAIFQPALLQISSIRGDQNQIFRPFITFMILIRLIFKSIQMYAILLQGDTI